MAEDALAQLARLTPPAPSVRQRQVVEDRDRTRLDHDLALSVEHGEAVRGEEVELRAAVVELVAAEESRVGPDAGQQRLAARRSLDYSGEIPLDVPLDPVSPP